MSTEINIQTGFANKYNNLMLVVTNYGNTPTIITLPRECKFLLEVINSSPEQGGTNTLRINVSKDGISYEEIYIDTTLANGKRHIIKPSKAYKYIQFIRGRYYSITGAVVF